MTKCILALAVAALLLCSCSNHSPTDAPSSLTPASPEQSVAPLPAMPVVPDAETPNPVLAETSTIRVSIMLEEGCTVIAGHDVSRGDTEPIYTYLYSYEPIFDMLISSVCERREDESVETIECGLDMYVPELSAGQAVKLFAPYPKHYDNESYYTQIAYTNSNGEYEAVWLLGEEERESPSLSPTEPHVFGQIYDDEYLSSFGLFSDNFKGKVLEGIFDAYIPNGLCIAGGAIGDVNGDGVEDALMCLTSDSYRIASYTGVMPLFVLTGQPGGEYSVELKVTEALFTPYRSSSYPIAGNGYIDIVYDYVGGAASHDTQVCRFAYDSGEKDWLLSEFSYQPTHNLDYSEKYPQSFVRPLKSFANLPLGKYSGNEFYDSSVDWSLFDAVCEISVPSWGEYNEVYTLAVVLNMYDGCYEGYIHRFYESLDSGGFIQTVRGEYKSGEELVIIPSDENVSFTIFDDTWIMDENDGGAFHLVK